MNSPIEKTPRQILIGYRWSVKTFKHLFALDTRTVGPEAYLKAIVLTWAVLFLLMVLYIVSPFEAATGNVFLDLAYLWFVVGFYIFIVTSLRRLDDIGISRLFLLLLLVPLVQLVFLFYLFFRGGRGDGYLSQL